VIYVVLLRKMKKKNLKKRMSELCSTLDEDEKEELKEKSE